MELSIELCSQRTPNNAAKFAALRPILNGLFAKGNYASFVGSEAFRKEYETFKAQLSSAPESDVAEHCVSLLRLHQSPPKGIVYRD
jgi:hypothetical protein